MSNFYQWLKESTDLNSFAAAILENPKESTPWLVAADFAEENDYPFANNLRAIGILCQQGMTENAAKEISEITNTGNNPKGRRELITSCKESIPWFVKWRNLRKDITPFTLYGIVPSELVYRLPKNDQIRCKWEIYFSIKRQEIICSNCYYVSNLSQYIDFAATIPLNAIARNTDYRISFTQNGIDLETHYLPDFMPAIYNITSDYFGQSLEEYLQMIW